ncbi:putative btb poz domain protein [Botryosphaeria dothidea]|uniref:Btb poz domain protein n=1 Tax=Botryosphaeria dothidea TaxID=55169 RepID=A0A8H4J3G2_9PEZI|nr:putative btb poz domain protein [Botryosphaeria dothidea]
MATTGALGLHAYLTSGEHSDVTIKFSGREFKAHKIILTAKSGWFRGAFRSGLAEASAETIELHGDDPDALELSIRFLYEEPYPRWTSDDEEKAHLNAMLGHITIYELANKYDIPTLSLAAAQALSSCFDKFSNVVENIAVARALYCSISHDGYGLKERFVKSLTADFRVLKPELQEFAKKNLEFAGHLLSDM